MNVLYATFLFNYDPEYVKNLLHNRELKANLMKLLRTITGFLIFFIACLAPLRAQEAPPFPITLEVGKKKDAEVLLGLKLDIHAPWRVYAPAPEGEVGFGFPPEITSESSDIPQLIPQWPVPIKEKMETGDVAYIYTSPMTVPISLTLKDLKSPQNLKVNVSFLACSDLCVPVEAKLSVKIPAGDVRESPQIEAAKEDVDSEYEGVPLGMLILGALLGGLILNFMPCVLPILSIKLLGLVKHAKHDDIVRAKKGFLISSLGILTSFLILGIVAVTLKASGEAVGWGIHFQNLYFLTFIFAILFLFAASLWGVFDFQLPETINNFIISEKSKGYTKDFLMGMFATLLATPCSAPFVGSAVGFALAHDATDIFGVFLTLGIGFSAPYWIAGLLPERFLWLPKPGPWMLVLERVLALALSLSLIWIGFLLTSHIPLWGIFGIILLLIIISLVIRFHEQGKLWTFKATVWVTSFLLMLILISPRLFMVEESQDLAKKYATAKPALDFWQPFDPEVIPQLVAQGKIIFVDITADWCVTCKANKQFVLNNPKITNMLASSNVVAMQGDWTKQDTKITDFLQTYARYGIPFNAIFGPHYSEGVILPELLSEDQVIQAFEKAGFEKSIIHN